MIVSNNYSIQPPRYNWDLKPFSMELAKGGITLLEGENGSGKSNVLKILSGTLIPGYSVNSFIGRETSSLKMSGFFQPIPFDPQLTLHQNKNLWGITAYSEDQIASYDALLDRLGLSGYLKTKWGAASSGTKQKFGVAMALGREADFYFLDEPLAHVDQASVETIAQMIREKQANNAAFLITTHLVKSWPLEFDQSYIIEEGQINKKPSYAVD